MHGYFMDMRLYHRVWTWSYMLSSSLTLPRSLHPSLPPSIPCSSLQAKSIAQPFAYDEYRKEKVKKRIAEQRANRVQLKKLPKVNRQLAERLANGAVQREGREKEGGGRDLSNPLGDDRFAALFTNPDYHVDEQSEVNLSVAMRHP